MNPQMQTQAQRELSTSLDITLSETDLLAGWGFDPHEIASLSLPLFSCLPMKKGGMPIIKERAQEWLSFVADEIS